MEYEKASSATAFSRKLKSGNGHSFSFSGNVIYDGVFASPAKKKSSAVDYGEIFRGSGAAIPFLEVPELKEKKVKVDVRSSKLDYSKVFGGFEELDFAVSHDELIVKPKKRSASSSEVWESKKTGIYSNVASPSLREFNSSPTEDKVSSPEDLHQSVRVKQHNLSYHQTNPQNENGTNGMTHITQLHAVSGYTCMVDSTFPSQKVKSNTTVPSAKSKLSNEDLMEGNFKKAGTDLPHSVASSRRSSKTDAEFQNISGKNRCTVSDKLFHDVCEIIHYGDQPKMPPPSSLQNNVSSYKAATEGSMGKTSGVSKSSPSEDPDTPCSPSYFDEETDANSAAAASAAAVKKAIEEAQLSIKIAKEIMERKKEGFYSCRKQSFYDGVKTEERKSSKDRGNTESVPDKVTQNFCEEDCISRQTCPKVGEEHERKARKLWEVPGGFSKSTLGHKQQEPEQGEAVQLGDERARRPRKLWEIPGGVSKAAVDHKPEEAEKDGGEKDENDSKTEIQSNDKSGWEVKNIAENTFYKLEQLGNKIKNAAAAFAGNKVDPKNDAVRGECGIIECFDNLGLADEVLNQENEKDTSTAPSLEQNHDNFLVAPEVESCERKLEEIHEPSESQSRIEKIEHIEPIGILMQDCLQKEEKKAERLDQDENASGSENASNGTEDETRLDDTPGQREFCKSSEEVYEMVKFREECTEACELAVDKEELKGRCSEGENDNRSDEAHVLERVDIMLNDISNGEETGNRAEQVGDSGLHENWNMLKQMFRQMFQTVDTKRDEEICGFVESRQMHFGQGADAENNEGANNDESKDAYKQDEIDTVIPELEEPCVDNRENEDMKLSLEVFDHEENGETADKTGASLVYKLTKVELATIEASSNTEEREQFKAAGLAQGGFELHESNEQANNPTEMLGYDQSEMDSSASDTKFEQVPGDQNSEEAHIVSKNRNDTEEICFESKHRDLGVEDEDLKQEHPEETSAASNIEEKEEELSSESKENGSDVEEAEVSHKQEQYGNAFKSSSEENLFGNVMGAEADGSSCKPEEEGETTGASDKMETSQCTDDDEDMPKEKDNLESFIVENECHSWENSEGAESHSISEPCVEIEEAAEETRPENNGVNQNESPIKEEKEAKEALQEEVERLEEHPKKIEKAKEKEKEREKERIMVERAIREARERAFAEARERAEKAAMEKANKELRRRTTAEARGRSEKTSVEVNDKSSSIDKASMEAKLRAERAAVERALAEARERALEKALSGKARNQADKSFGSSRDRQHKGSGPSKSSGQPNTSNQTANGEPAQRCKARSERNQRTAERAAKALAEKKLRDIIALKEQAERNRLAETLDAEVKRWASGKEGNLRALLSTLQYILGPESGWKPMPLTDLVPSPAVRKAYRKATLYVHPDKLQQRGAGIQQKYTCEKVFDLLKEAWNKFSAEER